MKKICLYFHIVKNQIIYVGIGNYKRPFEIKNRTNKYWKEITKNGYEIDIYKTGLTIKEACQLEIEWIAKIGRRDKGLGPLVNMTDGGIGISGLVYKSNNKVKNTKSMKYQKYIEKEKFQFNIIQEKQLINLQSFFD